LAAWVHSPAEWLQTADSREHIVTKLFLGAMQTSTLEIEKEHHGNAVQICKYRYIPELIHAQYNDKVHEGLRQHGRVPDSQT